MGVEIRTDYKMLIDGKWVAGAAGKHQVLDPSTGGPLAEVPEASPDQALQAISAARRAQREWGLKAPLERAQYMKKIASLVRRDAEKLARIISMEEGKPINEARGELGATSEFFEYFAEFARRIQGEILPSDFPGEQIWIQRVPIGVVAAIIPWNYPSALVSRKVAPAMIAGDTIVLKPHEDTPLSALEMARIFDEAGVPPGVVNVITGKGKTVGEAMCASADVDLISMTGSVPTGKRIMANAAQNLTPLSLELGGKAPFIVLADSDIDLAVKSAVTSRFMNCGQVCICNERTLVQKEIYDEFVERFIAESQKLNIGMPLDEKTDIGPKVSLQEMEKVERYVASAVREGAKLALTGGRPKTPPTEKGYWLTPTVITDVKPGMEIMNKEIFGPVIPIMPIKDIDEAIAISNASRYGLSSYLFTNDMNIIMRAVNEVGFGELYVNRIGPECLQAFHIGYKESGMHGDDGAHGLEAYLRKKTVYLNYSGKPTMPLMPYRPAGK